MALKKCKECGQEVSDKADKCPNCGAPIKKTSKSIGCLSLIIILIVIGAIYSNIKEYQKKADEKRRVERQQAISQEIADKARKEKLAFTNAIEDHYKNFVSLYKEKKYEEALGEFGLFRKHGKLDYKNVNTIYKNIMIPILEKQVKALPSSQVKDNFDIYNKLSKLDPANSKYKTKVAYYEKRLKAIRYRATCKLELVSWSWHIDYGYAIAEGQVKNISGTRLKNVEAMVTWYDKNGTMICSDSALIEYTTLMPNQTSPFKVHETYNPAMKSANLEFKHLMGQSIRTYRKK